MKWKSMVAVSILMAAFGPESESRAADISVTVKRIADEQGDVKATLCDAATFLTHNCPYKERQKAKTGDMVFTFKNVPPGQWAVLAYHDTNMNNDLDRNFLGIPTEQFGFSENPGYNHKPKFSESEFTVSDQDIAMDVILAE